MVNTANNSENQQQSTAIDIPKPTRIVAVTPDNQNFRKFRKSRAVLNSSEFSLEHVRPIKGAVVYRLFAEQVNKNLDNGTPDPSKTHYTVKALYGGQVKPKCAFSIDLYQNGRFLYTEPNPPKDLSDIESIVDDWLSFTQSYDPISKEKIYSFSTLAQAVNDGMTPIFSLLTFILFTQFQRTENLVGEARARTKLKSLPIDDNAFYGAIIIAYRAGVDPEIIESCFSHDPKAMQALTAYIENPDSQIKLLEGTVLDPNLRGKISINYSSKEDILKALVQIDSSTKDPDEYDQQLQEIWDNVYKDGSQCPVDQSLEALTELLYVKANPMTVNLASSDVSEVTEDTPEGLKLTESEQKLVDEVKEKIQQENPDAQNVGAEIVEDSTDELPTE